MSEGKSLRVTAQELKQHFLETAWPIVDAYVNAALGKADIESLNSSCREEVWDLIKSLMLQSSDKLELNIESPEDILKAVESGKCTFEEGDKLLSLYKKVKEIEFTGIGAGQLEGGGITINILQNGTNGAFIEQRESGGAGSSQVALPMAEPKRLT